MDTGHAPRGSTSAAVSARVLAYLDREERSKAWLARRLEERTGRAITDVWVGRKLAGRTPWHVDDLAAVADVLGITPAQLVEPLELADTGAAQPSALGVAVLFLIAVLVGVSLPAGTPIALLVAVVGSYVLFGVGRGVVASEVARRGRRD